MKPSCNAITQVTCLKRNCQFGLFLLSVWSVCCSSASAAFNCSRTLTADVVAIDQPLMFNRLGAQNINGMVYALRRDVVDDSSSPRPLTEEGIIAKPGHVFLRPDKRPRPLVLRVSAGDCLTVKFQNLLSHNANPKSKPLIPLDPAHSIPFSSQDPSDTIPSGVVPALTGSSAQKPLPQIGSNEAVGINVESVVPSFNLMKDQHNPSKHVAVDDQVTDRFAGFHVQGMQLVNNIDDDSSMVGKNANSLAAPTDSIAPGESKNYTLYAEKEGTFLVTSHGATFGSDGTAGNSTNGLFGSVNVEPVGARFYRSQVTDEEMRLAASADSEHIGGVGQSKVTPSGQPIIDYEAIYPNTQPWLAEGKNGLPILNMVTASNEIVHSDINAVIAGPDMDGTWYKQCPPKLKDGDKDLEWSKDKWTTCPYPLERIGRQNPSLPNRLEAFREFTVVFHDEMAKTNAFEPFYDRSAAANNPLGHTLKAVGDVFMINYGSGGIGSEIIANRLGVGPMHDCLGCNAEEFFLTSHAVGDPAMVVDIPANFGLENCKPHADPNGGPTLYTDDGNPNGPNTLCAAIGPKATRAYYPDDPSNVHHSYISDHVKFRNLHTGKEHHIFHLHNHQWLYNPNDDNANYLDAQAVGPGSGYTYEINFGGSGNRNKSAGDAIFHCHLYPHFAQGMWELWRNHDVFEAGTPLEVSGSLTGYHSTPFALQDGMPMKDPTNSEYRLRSLPDGEILVGTPIPALVPLPAKAMAPMPGKVYVVENSGRRVSKFDPTTGKELQKVAAASVAKVDRSDTDASLIDHTKTPLGNEINPTGLKNPGFPFWIAGVEHSVGQRPPTPPLDMMPDLNGNNENGGWDGGLPRHTLDGTSVAVTAAGGKLEDAVIQNETRFDLSKATKIAKPIWFPEDGTELERVAMAFHAVRNHPSSKLTMNGTSQDKNSDGTPVNFVTNGSGRPVAGAPFHEPCIDDQGMVMKAGHKGKFFDGSDGFATFGSSPFNADNPRVYKGADIQFDAVINKAGWHYPQERIIALWEDAKPIITKAKAPEPLVMRNNTFDCTMYLHTNLVPDKFEMDDYEVRTSTDIIGQHIHLPKWDLSTTDGSGNGWNYEDGTLAPGAVVERIESINKFNEFNRKAGIAAEIKDVEGNPVYTSENLISNKKNPPISKLGSMRLYSWNRRVQVGNTTKPAFNWVIEARLVTVAVVMVVPLAGRQ